MWMQVRGSSALPWAPGDGQHTFLLLLEELFTPTAVLRTPRTAVLYLQTHLVSVQLCRHTV